MVDKDSTAHLYPARTTCISLEYHSVSHLRACKVVDDGCFQEKPRLSEGFPLCTMRVSVQGRKTEGNTEGPFFLKEIRSVLASVQRYTADFCFVSATLAHVPVDDEASVGWPEIATSDRRVFFCSPLDRTRYLVTNQHMAALGFVLLDSNMDAEAVRQAIQSTLLKGSPMTLKSFRMPSGFSLSVPAESSVGLFDLSTPSHRLSIITDNKIERCHSVSLNCESECSVRESSHGPQFFLREPLSPHPQRTFLGSPGKQRLLPPGIDKRLSFNTSKNLPRLQSPMTLSTPGKKFLISYVQKEGRERAILLKAELESRGCSVFLDFENIAAGMDWQDILNNAVKVCEVFVPLITDSYGETLWTNREVKLADVMKKVVVPVSLIDSWPPSCLAIQFCTTQHVRWKSQHDNSEPGSTPPEAEKESVRNVAKEILELYRQVKAQNMGICMTAGDVETPPFDFRSAARRRRSTIRSYPYEAGNNDGLEEAKKARDGRPLIVVCAHISQTSFVEAIRAEVGTAKYDIWSTTDAAGLWPDPVLFRQSAVTPLFDGVNRGSLQGLQRFSHISTNSADTVSTVSPAESIDGCLFQEKADEAAIVLLILSGSFASSSICKHFLFYVERRKRFIPVMFDEFPMPGWMTTLIGNKDVEDGNAADFAEKIRSKLNRAVNLDNHAECTDEDLSEVNVMRGMDFLRNNNIPRDRTVYIAGSGSQGLETAFLGREIAAELAKLPGLCVATGGCLGVGEALSARFLEVRKNNWTSRGKMPECVYHVLPRRDDCNRKEIASQNTDGTFNPAATGRTFFFGSSLRERETVVGRFFKVCILIDGDTHAAHEATEAMWADNIVLPLYKSGGAAGGDYDFRMDKAPVGVSEGHWSVLRSKESTDCEIAVAVREILEIIMPDVTSKENMKRLRTPKTPKAKRTPLTPSSPYSLRERTGKKRMFDTDESVILEESVSAAKYSSF